jgi:hypothetical protein
MRYTVLNRFQGALLGAAIGEILGANCSDRNLANRIESSPWLTVQDWGFQPLTASSVGWGSLAVKQLRHLLQPVPLQPVPLQPVPLPNAASLPELEPSLSGLAIATLPIALFYHENPNQMQAQIRQAIAPWQASAESTIGVLLVGYTLSLILREQFSPTTLITDFIHYFDLPPTDPLIASLNSLRSDLPLVPTVNSPVLLALAAFLNTPDSYRLSLLQAAQLQIQPSVVCAIVGTLSGAYNGRAGLPLDWYSALQRRRSPALPSDLTPESASTKLFQGAEITPPLFLLWEVESEKQLLESAHQLFVSWSGMYDLTQCAPFSTGSSVLAAPRVIRSR